MNLGLPAYAVHPRSGGIHHPACLQSLVFAAESAAKQDSRSSLMTYIHRQHLTVITHHCTGFQFCHDPLGDQSLTELALRILAPETRPAASTGQQELQLS